MTIRFKNNTIEFESGTNQWVLTESPFGFRFNATISATQFNVFQNIGATSGYTSGGNFPGIGPYQEVTIDRFPFATNANATSSGSLSQARGFGVAGQSSPSSGYSSGGGRYPNSPFTLLALNTIDRFPFAAAATATDVGDLTGARRGVAGQSSPTSGYTSGGFLEPATTSNVIDSFPFASNANATDVGDLTQQRFYGAGQSSSTTGYTSGGTIPTPANYNTIDSFPFSTNANATDVGDLTATGSGAAGQNSTTSGYVSGLGGTTTVMKFSFASNGNAVDVGSLTQGRFGSAGTSSISNGYNSGGTGPNNTIDRFPFATEGAATDVGDLTQARGTPAGQQY
jgi:hypothetical protein